MNIAVLTPEKEVFNGAIKSVIVPGTSGEFEILSGHAPIVSSLTSGRVKMVSGTGEKINYTIDRGFIEVLNNEVSLLVQGLKEA